MAHVTDWLLDDSPASRMQARLGRGYRILLALARNPLAVVGAIIVALLVITALAAPLIATADPIAQNLSQRLLPPSAEHWMGTDELGRDIWSRVVFGSRITLTIVLLVAVICVLAGFAFSKLELIGNCGVAQCDDRGIEIAMLEPKQF